VRISVRSQSTAEGDSGRNKIYRNPLECTGNYNATSNEVDTLTVDVAFGTARSGLGGAAARQGPSLLYQM